MIHGNTPLCAKLVLIFILTAIKPGMAENAVMKLNSVILQAAFDISLPENCSNFKKQENLLTSHFSILLSALTQPRKIMLSKKLYSEADQVV